MKRIVQLVGLVFVLVGSNTAAAQSDVEKRKRKSLEARKRQETMEVRKKLRGASSDSVETGRDPEVESPEPGESFAGVWKGTYRCADTKGATLRLEKSGDTYKGHVTFYPVKSGPEFVTGRYTVSGKVTRGHLVLKPGKWIHRPGQTRMFSWEGSLERHGKVLKGRIRESRRCLKFSFKRKAGPSGVGELSTEPLESNGPEKLTCNPDDNYRIEDVGDHFRILMCNYFQASPQKRSKGGHVDTERTRRARAKLRDYIEGAGPDIPVHWRTAYVNLCGLELAATRDPSPNMTLTCKWHADNLELEALFEEHSWLNEFQRKDIRRKIKGAREIIENHVDEHFSREKKPRPWEAYYDLRKQIWSDYVEEYDTHSAYYRAAEKFDEKASEGEIEGCAKPLRSKLEQWLNASDEKTRTAVMERLRAPVGYRLTEQLARCHWYHDRNTLAGAYLYLLEDAPRKVTFGERLYYAQLAEIRKDADKKEKMPHLVGTKLLESDADDLSAPRVPAGNKARKRWLESQSGLIDAVAVQGTEIGRIERRDDGGMTLHFPERQEEEPVRECHRTDRIDYITYDGEVIYETRCEITGTKMVTHQIGDVKLEDGFGVSADKWVKAVHGPDNKSALLLSADGDGEDARVRRILQMRIE